MQISCSLTPVAKAALILSTIIFHKREANGIDKILMDSLLLLAIKILHIRLDIRNAFSYSYDYVFVDEFQDTTDEQYELLKLLFQNTDRPRTLVSRK
jgi:superfamily I DNA/RNA helicase